MAYVMQHYYGMKPFSDTSSLDPALVINDPKKEMATDAASGEQFAYKFPLRILVAEDNYINRRVFMMFLKHLGYHADCVENGLECLNMALQGNYDLILTDVDMPEMTGIECTRELRQAGIRARIIAVTGSKVENPRDLCLNAGMDGFIPKPFPPEELRHVLCETYRMKLANAEARRQIFGVS